MVRLDHSQPVSQSCKLLGVARYPTHFRPVPVSGADVVPMRLIDEIHVEPPFYGSRGIRSELVERSHRVGLKNRQFLIQQTSLSELCPKYRTRPPDKGHKLYPYLPRNPSIDRPNRVWAADGLYIPMVKVS